MKLQNKSALIGAAFLMATSAIGPGFLTQTTVFTQQLLASCGAVILLSIVLDIVVQLNIWSILIVSGKRASVLVNEVFPGFGHLLTLLVVLGGLAFNIGNIAGAGLGLNVLFGLSLPMGAVLSAGIAILLFMRKEAGVAMDWFVRVMGIVMILLTLYVAVITDPPLGTVVVRSIVPDRFSWTALITLVGGTVGGYITFAGGHRLLDAGISGQANLREVSKSAASGILLASLMRILLFLAALGVIMKGVSLRPDNPVASVYEYAAGQVGYKMFGIVIWAASITSVVGSAYTSISFFKTLDPRLEGRSNVLTMVFMLISTVIFVVWGKPMVILIWAGAINGFVLPIALALMLLAVRQKRIFGAYQHPKWLTVAGWLVVFALLWMSTATLIEQFF